MTSITTSWRTDGRDSVSERRYDARDRINLAERVRADSGCDDADRCTTACAGASWTARRGSRGGERNVDRRWRAVQGRDDHLQGRLELLCTALTNSSGIAQCRLTPLQEFEVLVSSRYGAGFAGDSRHKASSASAPVVVL